MTHVLTGTLRGLLQSWAEQRPQEPIEEQQSDEVSEDADLVLSDDEQLKLLETWAEQGPRGPIGASGGSAHS